MANNVFANNRELSCKAGAGKSICAFPDVCMTPPENPATPPGVPVPYPNTGMSSDTTEGSRTTKITGKEVMLKNKSYFKTSIGDEAGCAAKKGVVTSVNRGKVYFVAWSMDVKIEGENVVRHLDLTTPNHASPQANGPPTLHVALAAIAVLPNCKETIENEKAACNPEPTPHKPKSGKSGMKCTKKCAQARKCIFPPKNRDKQFCCSPRTTGHHIIPQAEFLEAGTRSSPKRLPDIKVYNPDEAPTACAAGHSWSTRNKDNPRLPLKGHGRFHRAYHKRMQGLDVNQKVSYATLRNRAMMALHAVRKGCNEKCTKAQLDHFHMTRCGIPENDPVCRVSSQKRADLYPPPQP